MSCVNSVEVPVCGLKLDLDLDALPGSDGIDYSTEEQWTGRRWIDGKKIYQKTVAVSLAANQSLDITHNVQNIELGLSITGICDNVAFNIYNPLPFITQSKTSGANITLLFDKTIIRLHNNNMAAGTAYVTIQYTCTDR